MIVVRGGRGTALTGSDDVVVPILDGSEARL